MKKELYDVLASYKVSKMRIQELTLQIEELETQLLPSGIRYDKDAVQVSPSDPMFNIISKVADLQRERDLIYKSMTSCLDNVNYVIDRLPDQADRLMMRYRWLSCMEWDDIAQKMDYSVEWCYKHNAKAIKHLEDVIGSVLTRIKRNV